MPLYINSNQQWIINKITENYGLKIEDIDAYNKMEERGLRIRKRDYREMLASGFLEWWFVGSDNYLMISKVGFILLKNGSIQVKE